MHTPAFTHIFLFWGWNFTKIYIATSIKLVKYQLVSISNEGKAYSALGLVSLVAVKHDRLIEAVSHWIVVTLLLTE